jgi:uncharacterized integral membrane protein (TIGR00697 family)
MNELIWCVQIILLTTGIIVLGLWRDDLLEDMLPLLPIAMNLFVTKLIPLFGHVLPSGDSLAVAYTLGLNIIAYYRGETHALHVLNRSTFLMFIWCLLCIHHVLIPPLANDALSSAHHAIFMPIPWICCASWISFYLSQRLERSIFAVLIQTQHITYTHAIATISSQIADTILFTCIGLCFQNIDTISVIAWSVVMKGVAWLVSILGVHIFYENTMAKRLSI